MIDTKKTRSFPKITALQKMVVLDGMLLDPFVLYRPGQLASKIFALKNPEKTHQP